MLFRRICVGGCHRRPLYRPPGGPCHILGLGRRGRALCPLWGIGASGISLQCVPAVRHILVIALHQILDQPLLESWQGVVRGLHIGVAGGNEIKVGGQFLDQRVSGGIIVDAVVPQVIVQPAPADLPVQHIQGASVKGDGVGQSDNGRMIRLRLLRLGLGEHGIGFADDLLMEPVVKRGVVIILPQKICVLRTYSERRPFDSLAALQIGVFLVRIGTGVLIGRIRQHHFLDHGRVVLVNFLNSGILAQRIFHCLCGGGLHGVPVLIKGQPHILAVPVHHSLFFDVALLADVFEPALGKGVQIAPQSGDPSAGFGVYLLINLDRAILPEGQRFQRSLLTVHPEGHFRVIHQIAVQFICMADGERVLIEPFQVQGHHALPSFQLQIAVLAADQLGEQLCQGAVIELRLGTSGLLGGGSGICGRHRFGEFRP